MLCRRETKCEFCTQELPSWRDILTPSTGLNLQAACMNVNFFNKVYSFKVMPGPQVRTRPATCFNWEGVNLHSEYALM